MKKGLSLLLSLLMVISMFSCLTVVASAASDYQLDVLHTVLSQDEGVFVVEEAGNYVFSSYGEGDPQITIYDSTGDYITEFDDDAGRDFQGVVYLEAGEYKLSFHNYRADEGVDTINFKIEKLEENAVSATITLAEPMELVAELGGWWDSCFNEAVQEHVSYYHYDYSLNFNDGDKITITYNDSSVVSYIYDENVYSWVSLDGNRLVNSRFFDNTDQASDNWLPSKDNYITLNYLGAEINIPVEIIENPVAAIEFSFVDNVYLVEEADGWWETCYNDECGCDSYFRYNIPSANLYDGNTITVTYTDGREVSYTFIGYDENYDWINAWMSDDGELLDLSQSDVYTYSDQEESHWVIGGENLITVSYMDKTTQVSIPVKANPVESIEFTPANPEDYTLLFEADGRLNGEGFGEPYFHYYTPDLRKGDVLTIEYTDGSVVDYVYQYEYWDDFDNYHSDGWYSENGEKLDERKTYVSFNSNQSEVHWTLGNDNYVTVKYMYKECKIPVTIIENPVESIEFTPKTAYEFIENLKGYWDDRYNEETGEDEEYFYYQTQDIYNYGNELTVNYTDGSKKVFVFQNDDDYNNGWYSDDECIDYYDVSWNMNQYDNPWVIGGDNYFTVEYAGRECQVPVTIKSNPVESIEFIPKNGSLSVFENTGGGWMGYWDSEADKYVYTYYEYDFQEIVEQSGNAIKVNYTDDTTSTYYYSSFEDCWIDETDEILDYDYLGFWATQYEGNSWTIGNNSAKLSYYGKETEVTVKVLEEIPDVTDGIFTAEVISETECYITDIAENPVVNGVLTIPEAIDGYTVTGMESWLLYDFSDDITEINLPSGFESFSTYQFNNCEFLEKVNVAEDNKTFKSLNGVVYNKAMTEIVYCPPCFKGELYIPAEVEEIDGSILAAMGNASSVVIDANNSNFVIENGIIYNSDFTKIVKALSLPENYVMKSTVTEIGQCAFSGNTTVKNVTVNSTVTEISYGAFMGCSSLEAIALPEGLVSIAYAAFENSGIKSITLPSTVECIYNAAFLDCSNLTSVSLNNGLEEIHSTAFENSGLTSVVIPDSVTYLGGRAFYNCDSLTSVVIGSGVSEIAGYVFGYCGSLKELNVPATVESIYESSIRGCSSLERINVDANNPNYSSIDGVLFNKNASCLYVYPDGKAGGYAIPATVNYISSEAFDSASITSVVIPDSVISLGSEAFINCTSLSQVVLSENLTEIDYCTFEGCSSLTEVNIPASVTYINGHAFIYCTALKAINVAEANTEYASQNGILYSKDKETLILAPYGIEGAVVVPQGTKYISAFNDCEKVTSIVLPEGVTSIGGAAFSDCTSLTEINIPDTVTNISYMAFENCSSLKSIKLPSQLTEISWNTFRGCTSLEAIEIPASVTYIEGGAFYNCTSLTDVYFTGTEEQWNAIEIEEGNEDLLNATIHFNSFMPGTNLTPELKELNGRWVYASGNTIITDYTGLVEYAGNFFYVENGILRWDYTGLAPYGNEWFYVSGGIIDFSYTGLVAYAGTFFYVQNGWLNWGYTGLAPYYNDWFYVTNGVIDFSYTGLVAYAGTFFYVQNGWLNWNYTGIALYYSDWYYVTNGVIDFSYTGLTPYGNDWYYVENGWLNFNYTGLVAYAGTFFYVQNGWLNWGYTGLAPYGNDWFYVSGGIIDFSYTGYTNYGGYNFYITNGWLDWSKQ